MRIFRCAKILLLLLLAGLTLHASAPSDGLTGVWHWETDGGDRQITMHLRADGGKLTGSVDIGETIIKRQLSNFGPGGGKLEIGSIDFKIGKSKVDGRHFTFLLETTSDEQVNVPRMFMGDVTGNVIHAFETVGLYGKEIHRIAFAMNRVQQP